MRTSALQPGNSITLTFHIDAAAAVRSNNSYAGRTSYILDDDDLQALSEDQRDTLARHLEGGDDPWGAPLGEGHTLGCVDFEVLCRLLNARREAVLASERKRQAEKEERRARLDDKIATLRAAPVSALIERLTDDGKAAGWGLLRLTADEAGQLGVERFTSFAETVGRLEEAQREVDRLNDTLAPEVAASVRVGNGRARLGSPWKVTDWKDHPVVAEALERAEQQVEQQKAERRERIAAAVAPHDETLADLVRLGKSRPEDVTMALRCVAFADVIAAGYEHAPYASGYALSDYTPAQWRAFERLSLTLAEPSITEIHQASISDALALAVLRRELAGQDVTFVAVLRQEEPEPAPGPWPFADLVEPQTLSEQELRHLRLARDVAAFHLEGEDPDFAALVRSGRASRAEVEAALRKVVFADVFALGLEEVCAVDGPEPMYSPDALTQAVVDLLLAQKPDLRPQPYRAHGAIRIRMRREIFLWDLWLDVAVGDQTARPYADLSSVTVDQFGALRREAEAAALVLEAYGEAPLADMVRRGVVGRDDVLAAVRRVAFRDLLAEFPTAVIPETASRLSDGIVAALVEGSEALAGLVGGSDEVARARALCPFEIAIFHAAFEDRDEYYLRLAHPDMPDVVLDVALNKVPRELGGRPLTKVARSVNSANEEGTGT